MTTFTRIALTLALLVTVWFRAHWSVALTLTLIAIHAEAVTFLVVRLRRDLSKLTVLVADGLEAVASAQARERGDRLRALRDRVR